MIGWVQAGGQAHADRYMYLPLVGLAIAVVFELERATARATPRTQGGGGAGIASVLAAGWRGVRDRSPCGTTASRSSRMPIDGHASETSSRTRAWPPPWCARDGSTRQSPI